MRIKRLSYSDVVALFAIVATLALIALRWGRFPIFVDIYYHLSVMEMFDQAGGIVIHDFLQFAPEGRDHLYPPLLHISMLIPYKAGVSADAIGKVVSAGIYPLILCSIWYVVRELFSRKAACIGVLLLLTSWSFFYTTAVVSAAGTATIIALWTYYFTAKGRWVSAGIAMALCIYSHLSYPHLIAGSLVLIALLDPSLRRQIAKTLTLAYALASPWVVLIIARHDAISQTSMTGGLQQVELLLVVAAAAGFVLACKNLFKREYRYAVPVSMLASMVPILFFYPSRFFVHGSVPLAILGGLFLAWAASWMGERTSKKNVASGAVICIMLLVVATGGITVVSGGQAQPGGGGQQQVPPQQQGPPMPGNQQQIAPPQEQSNILELRIRTSVSVLPALLRDNLLGDPNHIQPQNALLIDAVATQTVESDVIVIQNGIQGCMVSSYTGRATTNGMFRETANNSGPPDSPTQYDTYRIPLGNMSLLVLRDANQDMPRAFPWWAAMLLLFAAIANIAFWNKRGM